MTDEITPARNKIRANIIQNITQMSHNMSVVIQTLAPFLTPHIRDLRIVLAASEASRTLTRGLDPVVADCNLGPHDRTNWISISAQNLPKGGPVKMTKEGERRNWLEIPCGEEIVKFAPYFGYRDTFGRYKVWRKGRETYDLAGVQETLFGWKDTPNILPDIVYPYALRILRKVEDSEVFELHLLLGLLPETGRRMSAGIRHFGDPFIITMDDNPRELVPGYTSPFDPEGIG